MCHLILLMPVLGLAVLWVWPLSAALPAYGLIVALSVWSYWFVLKAMHQAVITGRESMCGAIGRMVEVAERIALVRVHSEISNTESADTLRPGDWVQVVEIAGLLLRVSRLDEQDIRGGMPDGRHERTGHVVGGKHEHTYITHA
ncbi:MAG: NfeD family protein [Thiobacillaceae bacterium]